MAWWCDVWWCCMVRYDVMLYGIMVSMVWAVRYIIYIYITLLHFGVVERSVKLVWVSFSNNAKPTTLVVVWALWPHITLRSLDVCMAAIVPQVVVTDNRLGINSCHAISRLYQATLMSCGTAKHVSVDCTIYIIYIYYVKIDKCVDN